MIEASHYELIQPQHIKGHLREKYSFGKQKSLGLSNTGYSLLFKAVSQKQAHVHPTHPAIYRLAYPTNRGVCDDSNTN